MLLNKSSSYHFKAYFNLIDSVAGAFDFVAFVVDGGLVAAAAVAVEFDEANYDASSFDYSWSHYLPHEDFVCFGLNWIEKLFDFAF